MGNKKQDSSLENRIICGDNLEILPTIEKDSIDLVYIDPPFFSNRNYEIIWGDESEIRSFEDRWEGGINVYTEWMRKRVREIHRVLKPTGSFYLHCDWHAGHYLKVICDEIFGYNNFVNEIIWNYSIGGRGKKRFARKHDTIFFYAKDNKKYLFNEKEIRVPMDAGTKSFGGRLETDEDGRKYRLVYGKGSKKYYKYYLDKGKIPEDVWQIQSIQSQDKERLGYPTQKPEALLERIIKASSNKGDICLDSFCGCGTTLAVAYKLGRKWIGIDISPSAISLIKNRMNIIGASEGRDYEVIGMPKKIDDLKNFKPYDFQYWVINELYGTPSPRKAGDMGIDGFSFMEHYPIQVKQSEHIGRNIIDNFETALRRYYKTEKKDLRGYVVAFGFGKGAYEEVARVKKEGIEIILITVQDILDEKFSIKNMLS